MAMTFRQEVIKIICLNAEILRLNGCTSCGFYPTCSRQINDICEAAVRMGERMPLVDRSKYFFPFLAQEVALNQRADGQAHIKKECEG